MTMTKSYLIIAIALCLIAPFVDTAFCQDVTPSKPKGISNDQGIDSEWPQWRGPNRDGKLTGVKTWPESIQAKGLSETWSQNLGPSYSGPILSKELVFTTETVDGQREVVRALDRQTGEQKWETGWEGAMSVPFFANANGSWIRSTPAFDGEFLYVAGMRDMLVCLRASDGKEIWSVDFVKSFGTQLPSFGFVCSPLVDGDFVYVQAGGGLCKLNKTTGEIAWRSLVDNGGMNGSAFSSPVMVNLSGNRQLLVQTRSELAGVNPENGEMLWSKEIPTFRGMNILTPTVYKNSVFTSAYGGTTQLFNVATTTNASTTNASTATATEAWKNRASAYMSSPVVIGDYVYLHLRNQRLTCIDLKSGESKWTTKPFGKYWSMVVNGDRILALDERGDLLLIRANPEKFELIESRKISEQPTWAHLAVAGDQIFIRELRAIKSYRWSDLAN
jgi:outer membrane protein assembly factor BamB